MNRTVTKGILAAMASVAAMGLLTSPVQAQGWRCLAPNGVDDTDQLQSALERCSGAESRCVVRLCRGVFRTAPLRLGDFRGVLRGARWGRTVIEALPGLRVNNRRDGYWRDDPLNLGVDPWPFLLQFVGGQGRISDLTIEIPSPAPEERPTLGWTETANERYELAGAILITGQDPVAFGVSQVSIVAGEDPASAFDTTLFAGVSFRGLIHNPADPSGFPVYPVTGRYRISESELAGMVSGTELGELEGAEVEVTENDFRSVQAVAVLDGSRSEVRVDGNRWDVGFVGVQVILNVDGEPSVDNTFTVTQNFGTVGPWYSGSGRGIYFKDPFLLPEPGGSALRVTRNLLTLGTGDEAAASAVEAYGAGQLRVRGNWFEGRTGVGIRVDQTSGCRITWNDLGGLDTGGGPDLDLGPETSECLAVVGRDDIVFDDGIDNRIFLR